MRIISAGPVVTKGRYDYLMIQVENDDGAKFSIRLFADLAATLLANDQLVAAVRAVLLRRQHLDPKLLALRGTEL